MPVSFIQIVKVVYEISW